MLVKLVDLKKNRFTEHYHRLKNPRKINTFLYVINIVKQFMRDMVKSNFGLG